MEDNSENLSINEEKKAEVESNKSERKKTILGDFFEDRRNYLFLLLFLFLILSSFFYFRSNSQKIKKSDLASFVVEINGKFDKTTESIADEFMMFESSFSDSLANLKDYFDNLTRQNQEKFNSEIQKTESRINKRLSKFNDDRINGNRVFTEKLAIIEVDHITIKEEREREKSEREKKDKDTTTSPPVSSSSSSAVKPEKKEEDKNEKKGKNKGIRLRGVRSRGI